MKQRFFRFGSPDKFSLAIAIIALLGVTATTWWLIKAKWPLGVKGDWVLTPGTDAWPRGAWGLPLVALFIFGGFAVLCAYDRVKRAKNRREQIASTRWCLIGICLLSFVWPWALLGPAGTSNLIASQWSDVANEYFGTAYLINDARRFSGEYAAMRQQRVSVLQAHVATHPPGAVLFYYGARRVYETIPLLQSAFSSLAASLTTDELGKIAADCNTMRSSAARAAGLKTESPKLSDAAVGGALWSAFLISVLLASSAPAIYFIASSRDASTQDATQIVNAETRGLIAAALWALCPAANLFAFTLDAVIAAGTAWTLAFLALRLRGGKPIWSFLAGATLALTSFVSFGALAVSAILFFGVLFFYGRDWRAVARECAFVGAGFSCGWLILMVLFPMQPIVIYSQAMAAHHFATGARNRNRVLWTWMNLLTFAVFSGWPLCIVALAALAEWRDATRVALAVGAAGVLTILLLTVSGKVMGEVERLWLFLIPAFCVLASMALARRAQPLVIGAILVLQATQTLLLAAYLWPIVRPI